MLRVIPPFAVAAVVGRGDRRRHVVDPAAGAGRCCWSPWSSRPPRCRGSPAAWPGGRSPGRRRPAAISAAAVVDLIDGAPRAGGHGRRRRAAAADRPAPTAPARAARRGAGHRRHRPRPHHRAGRAGQLGRPDPRVRAPTARHARRRPAGRARPRPAGRLRAGVAAARGHPGAPALAYGGRPGVRRHRRTRAVESPTRRCRWPPRCRAAHHLAARRCGPRIPGPPAGAPRVDLDLRAGTPGGPGRAERGRQVDAGRRAGALPARRRRRGTPGRHADGPLGRPTTCAGSSGWSSRARTSSTPPWPRTCGSGRASATDAELAEVLDRVGLAGWLAGLPEGLATEVGTAGARLSGGQRQRVAVARALLADFPILVLDEPAEHLDPAAADALTADLLALTEGRSTLLHHPPAGRAGASRRDRRPRRRPGRRAGHPRRTRWRRWPLRRPVVGRADERPDRARRPPRERRLGGASR